jgi:hypothetical protein
VPAWNTVEFNQTIVVYLSQQASTSATTGFGSNRAVFIGDTIDVHWGAETDSEIDRYCLVCSEPYFGIEGWPACENCMDPTLLSSRYY